MNLLARIRKSKQAKGLLLFILMVALVGIFAPFIAPNDPYETNLIMKFKPFSAAFPLGTDHLGRCILSRLIYGIRPTLFLSLLTMLGTIFLGAFMGIMAGYFKGWVDEVIMRIVDVMLSFPSQIMIFAVIALFGVNMINVILANVFIKWAWYARMIRTKVLQYREKDYILYSKCVGSSGGYILRKHLIPNISAELVVLATLDIGWAIINISTLSFLGLGVQAPMPEWGAMLSEAKNVMMTNPVQMFAPGIAIILMVSAFNMLGDVMRDVLDPKEVFE
ncbi:nickel/cobalt ABC transporter permease [Fusibacter sp. 3D3]|uniref:nickel/cobalt ABC transporter permease n=1 Tax=Fusibacter sp. 3D3 TaxID=1048380 RepID=UPI000852ABD3|nr:nickel/cobalt ABC transporter permease [Fusibacter sp. 3D3]GAU76544.1 nickel transport system permease protein NikC [Fusibacter sp. 3D3]